MCAVVSMIHRAVMIFKYYVMLDFFCYVCLGFYDPSRSDEVE
jgi:hypothetical protein